MGGVCGNAYDIPGFYYIVNHYIFHLNTNILSQLDLYKYKSPSNTIFVYFSHTKMIQLLM